MVDQACVFWTCPIKTEDCYKPFRSLQLWYLKCHFKPLRIFPKTEAIYDNTLASEKAAHCEQLLKHHLRLITAK